MKAARTTAPLCLAGSLLVLLTAATGVDQAEFVDHKVVKGETVSLLCIQFYGYYSAELGEAVKKHNPAVTDVNVIRVGQELRFPKPRAAKTEAAALKPPAAATAEESLFEKKVAATQGVVTYVEGDATLKPRDGHGTQKLAANSIVYPGDVIETGASGRVELIINRESVVRMKEKTRMTVEAFRDNAGSKGTTRMGFTIGTLWTKVKEFKDKVSRFELELPTAIAGVHGTVYQTEVNADSSSEVKVFNGEVAVSNRAGGEPNGEEQAGLSEVPGPGEVPGPQEVSMEQWIQIVKSMQRLYIDKKGKPSAPKAFKKNPGSDWEKWNEERDKRIGEMFGAI